MENEEQRKREENRRKARIQRRKTQNEMLMRGEIRKLDELAYRGRGKRVRLGLQATASYGHPQSLQTGSDENPIEIMDFEDIPTEGVGQGQVPILEGHGSSPGPLPLALVPLMIDNALEEMQRNALNLMQAFPAPPAYPMSFMKGRANELGFEKYMNSVNIERADKMLSEMKEYKQGLQIRNHVIDMELSAAAPHGIFPELPVSLIQSSAATSAFDEPD